MKNTTKARKAITTSPNLASLFLFATSASSVYRVRRSLSAHSDQMFFWLVVASTVTGLGVILEAPAELREPRRWWRLRRLNKTVGWRVPITFVGLLLVICGIVGEGIFEFLSANAETNIRAYDERFSAIPSLKRVEQRTPLRAQAWWRRQQKRHQVMPLPRLQRPAKRPRKH